MSDTDHDDYRDARHVANDQDDAATRPELGVTGPRCPGCRYWSQMCAQALGGGPLEALCLCPGGEKQGRFTTEHYGCPRWAENTHGAWDEPPDYGEAARALYELEGS